MLKTFRLWLKSAIAVFAMAVVVMSITASTSALAQAEEKVAQVVVTGNKNINADTILNVIKLAPGSEYTKAAVEIDRTAINAIGYFSAVTVRTETTPEGLRVIYDVTENPVVKSIKIEGGAPVPDDVIHNLMRAKPGQVLNTDTLNIDIESIQRYYKDEGYVAYVTEDIGIDRESGELTIPILVYTVESVDVVGNKKTREHIFTREMKTRPGVVFNMKALRDDISRIYNLDFLEDIETPKIEPGTAPGKLSIVIAVKEKKTGQVSLGVGYSSRSKLVGRAELAETNLRGRGQGVTFLYETGTSDSNLGGKNSYEIGFREPWIDKKNTSVSLNIFNKLLYRFSSSFIGGSGSLDGETYNERRKGGSVGLSRPIANFSRAYLTLRGESVSTSDIDTGEAQGFVAQNGNVQSANMKWVNNTRDFDRDPADGWYRSASLEIGRAKVTQYISGGSEPLSGGFQKFQVDVRHYWSKGGKKETPTDKRNTLAARLIAGAAGGEIPFFEQYFVGGGDTLRGYREDRFWGDKMAVLSVEYRKPIAQSLQGVLFADYGDAWGGRQSFVIPELPQHSGFDPSLGVGIGLRVNTPIGLLRLDYGSGSEGSRTYFSIGQPF